MGSKSIRDGESPSSSSLFLPQRRQSRRGSLASLSSTTQLDKEMLSQALDQIHNTASQTETLTTFNEYTSPPSSSLGPDSKGIASELQGGLSGLYSRLRASVGNVKDSVNPGGEDGAAENTSLNSPKAGMKSLVPSAKKTAEHSRVSNSSAASFQSNSTPQAGKQPPTDASNASALKIDTTPNKSSTALLGSNVSRSNPKSTAILRSSPAQANQPMTASPTLVEVNISAVKQGDSNGRHLPDPKAESLADPIRINQDSKPQKPQSELVAKSNLEGIAVSSYQGSQLTSLGQGAAKSTEGGLDVEHAKFQHIPQGRASGAGEVGRSISRRTDSTIVGPFSVLDDGRNVETGYPVSDFSSDAEGNDAVLPRIVTSQSNKQDDVFTGPSATTGTGVNHHNHKMGGYQHLELPLRQSMAPPLISRSNSENPSLTRVSSSETNTDSLTSSALLTMSNIESKKPQKVAASTANTSRPADPASVHRDLRTMNVFSQVKNKVLNKEYWMKDQNAKDCFYCGDSFTTFRRKHHCRTCGQIFDSKCTSLISGQHFGQAGNLRVCKPCEGIILDEDDSSEFSDDGSLSVRGIRPRHGSTGAGEVLGSPLTGSSPTNTKSLYGSPKHPDLAVPTMSIPATRKAGRDSNVLEIDAQRTLARPSSSRSLKSSFANKSHHAGHRRHNSRMLLQRSFKAVDEESAPFHQNPVDDKARSGRLPAFHDDNIIDPDLAPYLSDEASSGEEQMSMMAALNGDGFSRSHDNERHGFSRLAATKGPRSRIGDKSISGVTFASRDADTHSLNSSSATNVPRSLKRRNLSTTSNAHLRPSPRGYRASLVTPTLGLGLDLQEHTSISVFAEAISSVSPAGGSRMIRSSSMKGEAAPAIELNNASLLHVRRLLHQLLQDSHVPNVASWERALMPILLRATDDVNPDMQNGDDIDIRHYVKLKKISGGRPGDTSYVSGLVFTKNLALKSMPRSISHPNILILTFALEYARHQQHFMSIDPIIRQEREYLQNVVNRIAALRPQLLLVERNVSGLALEFLEQANIATAYNVKASVLEAVSRCCQTRIISSMDKLAIKPAQAGKCASFYLKTYVNEGRKKTYMFLSGCAKELGCTVVLRGDDDMTLAKMKRITEFMIFVVYNLKLETCLMRDEFAAIPSNLEIGSMSPGKDPLPKAFQAFLPRKSEEVEKHSDNATDSVVTDSSQAHADTPRIHTSQPKISEHSDATKPTISLPDEDSVPEDVPMPTFYGDMVEEHKTKILSASPFVKFMQPYLLMRSREQERRLAYLKRLRDQDVVEEQQLDEKAKPEKFDLITPEMVHEKVHNASRKVREVLHAVHDAEYDKALHNYQTQSKQWEAYIAGNTAMFDPYAHQNIAVLYSLVCSVTTVPCSGPDMLVLSFYNEHDIETGFEADCTLGQYVEDLCMGANAVCIANGCERRMLEHHRQYVHGEAQLSVFVERHPCKLRGLQDSILMWSTCRICGKETQTLPMSESSWKYSFGKYLELSFWCSDLHARADVCPHDLHRNHLRYFGFKDMAIRVHYDPITLLEIIVPRARITWKVDNDLRFKNELFTKIEKRLSKFMISVAFRIRGINIESVVPEKTESCKQEVDKLSKRASDEHHALVQKLREKYMNSKHYEIIPLNRAVRAVQEKVAEWDKAFADFDRDFFPSEKDIRRLTTLQLKKIFLDRDDSISSLNSTDDGSSTTTIPEEGMTKKTSLDSIPTLTPQTRRMSPEKAQDLLAAVVEKHVSTDGHPGQHQSAPPTAMPILDLEATPSSLQDFDREEIRHLDLAVSSEKYQNNQRSAVIDNQQVQAVSDTDDKSRVPVTQPEAGSDPNYSDPSVIDGGKGAQELSSKSSNSAEKTQISGIPRRTEGHHRATRSNVSPTISRTQSQPAHLRNNVSSSSSHSTSGTPQCSSSKSQSPNLSATPVPPTSATKPVDRKLSDRLGLNALKQTSLTAGSMIPRSITNRRKDSKVSNLAKHFEQLSREFEKERMRERRERAARSRQARAYPMAASKPIVQVYRSVDEAVGERDPSDEDISSDPPQDEQEGSRNTINHMAESTDSQTPGEGFHAEETTADNTETDDRTNDSVGSDAEGDGNRSDEEHSILDDIQIPGTADEHHALSPEEANMDIKLDLPKHEKSSLMKMLTNFWAERSASGWQPLEYPLNATDHIFADSDIIVREDEPSSLIAFALGSEDYQVKLRNISKQAEEPGTQEESSPPQSSCSNREQAGLERSLLKPTGTHLKYQFVEGSATMLCKVFYAEQFDAVRRKCGVSERIVESLSRCMKWDSKGGKTKSVFLKTLDDRFVLKSLSPIETKAFLTFAPAYFRIMSESLFHELPSVIAKMLGFYQVIIKNSVTGVEFNWFLLVMENLFYDRSQLTRIFDLKGSMRNRRIQSTGERNEVLLDENMVEFIYESPLFSREHSKKLLRASVWNDTLFLSRQNVMDYSLMVAIDENRKELVVGIIDCIRTYTWDKKFETWIKDRGKNRPTVTSPKEYKSRFREAMGRYVLQAPNCWHQFKALAVDRPLRGDDPGDDREVQVVNL